MQNNCGRKDEVTYAGFWVRMAAYLIDNVAVFVALLLVRLFLAGILSVVEGTALAGNILFHYTLKDIVLYIGHVLYFILFTYYTGTTPGKKLLNLRVVSVSDEKLTLTDVVYRETIGRFICRLTVYIGYIMAGVDEEKRGLHDMLCDTRVIYAKKVTIIPAYAPRAEHVPNIPEQVMPLRPDVACRDMPPQDYNRPYRMVRPEERNEERDS